MLFSCEWRGLLIREQFSVLAPYVWHMQEELQAAQARFKALPCYEQYVESEDSLRKLDAAINGIQKFLEGNGQENGALS